MPLSFRLDDPSTSTVRLDNIGISSASTGVEAGEFERPSRLAGRARPNPFTASTTLSFALERPGRVEAAVYDIRGRRVAVLLDEHRSAGPGFLTWDGRDGSGGLLSPGVYFLRLRAGGEVETRKVHLLR